MRAYAVRRLSMVIPTLFLVTVLVFLSVRFLPGDIIDVMQMQMERSWSRLGHEEIDRAAMERRLGLDVPVYVQYGRWVGGIFLRGTLGQSLMGGDTVEQSIAQRLPVTIQLGLMAILIGLVIAVPVGIYSAIRQDTAGDYVGQSLAILGLATPNFWLATMVIPRLTLGVGLAATAVNVLVALVVGGVSGFIGGRLDLTVQRLVDAWMSIPGLLILLTVMSVVGRGVLQIIVVLGVLGGSSWCWGYCGIGASRVVRGAVIAAKENVYFEAARAVGSSRWRTLVRHLVLRAGGAWRGWRGCVA